MNINPVYIGMLCAENTDNIKFIGKQVSHLLNSVIAENVDENTER